MTVADAMKNLTTTEKLVPLDVRVAPYQLAAKTAINYHVSMLVLWLIRSLIVWGFLAVFFPALGVTYVLVMAGLYVVRHIVPPSTQEMIWRVNNK